MKRVIIVASVLVVFSLFLPGANAQVTPNAPNTALEAILVELQGQLSRLQEQVNTLRSMPVPPAPQQVSPVPYPVPPMPMPYPAPQTPLPVPYTPEPSRVSVPPQSFPEPTLVAPLPATPIPPGQGYDKPPVKPDRSWCHAFNVPLGVGAKGDEVKALKIALGKEGFPTEENDDVYDEDVAAAVSAVQEKYRSDVLAPAKLSYPTGFTGPRTLKKLKELYGCDTKPVLKPEPPKPSGKITITSPNGGESWNADTPRIVRWRTSPTLKDNLYFYLLEEFAGVWKPVLMPTLDSVPAAQGAFAFPGSHLGGTRKFKIRVSNDPREFGICIAPRASSRPTWCTQSAGFIRTFDDSDESFTYTSPSNARIMPDFVKPVTEEKWRVGSVERVEWTYFGTEIPKEVRIYLAPEEDTLNVKQIAGPFMHQEKGTDITVPDPNVLFRTTISPNETYVLIFCEGVFPACEISDTSVGIHISSSPVITQPPTAGPKILKLTPSSGPVGTKVAIVGSGFYNEDTIQFGDGIVFRYEDAGGGTTHYSQDGTTLTFYVPLTYGPKCLDDPKPCEVVPQKTIPGNKYPVIVSNKGGTSNPATFTVTEGSIQPTPLPSAVNIYVPAGGEQWKEGQTYLIKWTVPAGIQNEQAQLMFTDSICYNIGQVNDEGRGCGAYTIGTVPVKQGYYNWTIPRGMKEKTYGVSLDTPMDNATAHTWQGILLMDFGGKRVASKQFTILGNDFTASISGVKSTYVLGETITMALRGVEYNGNPALPEGGFTVWASINNSDPSRRNIQGVYDPSSKLWRVTLAAPTTSRPEGYTPAVFYGYQLSVSLNCSNENLCAAKYSSPRSKTKVFNFNVAPASY